jgi:hypothetical protein
MSVVRSHARSKTRVAGQIQKLSVVAGASGRTLSHKWTLR